jgi:hypothetical protein
VVYFKGESRVVFAFALLACACGGSPESPGAESSNGDACPMVTPCGGDLVGDWHIKQMCLGALMAGTTVSCPGSTVNLSQLMASGTISFRADHTMNSSAALSFTESAQLPPSCYSEAQCTALAANLASSATVTNSHCAYDSVSGCSCSLISTQATTMSNGSYEVQGSNVNLTDSKSGKTTVNTFCVSGNTASLFERDANGASGTIILVR